MVMVRDINDDLYACKFLEHFFKIKTVVSKVNA